MAREIILEYTSADALQGDIQLFLLSTDSCQFSMNYDASGEKLYLNYISSEGERFPEEQVDLYSLGEDITLEKGMMLYFRADNDTITLEVKDAQGSILKSSDGKGYRVFGFKNNYYSFDESIRSDSLEFIEEIKEKKEKKGDWKYIGKSEYMTVTPKSETGEGPLSKPESETYSTADKAELKKEKEDDDSSETTATHTSVTDSSFVKEKSTLWDAKLKVVGIGIIVLIVVATAIVVVLRNAVSNRRNLPKFSHEKKPNNNGNYKDIILHPLDSGNHYVIGNINQFINCKNKVGNFSFMNKEEDFEIYKRGISKELLIHNIPKEKLEQLEQLSGFHSYILGFNEAHRLVGVNIAFDVKVYDIKDIDYGDDEHIKQICKSLNENYGLDLNSDSERYNLACEAINYLINNGSRNSQLKEYATRLRYMTQEEKNNFQKYQNEFLTTIFKCWSSYVRKDNRSIDPEFTNKLERLAKSIFETPPPVQIRTQQTIVNNDARFDLSADGSKKIQSNEYYHDSHTAYNSNESQNRTLYMRQDNHNNTKRQQGRQHNNTADQVKIQSSTGVLDAATLSEIYSNKSGVTYCNLTAETTISRGADGVKLLIFKGDEVSRTTLFCVKENYLIPNVLLNRYNAETLQQMILCFEMDDTSPRPNKRIKRVEPATVVYEGNGIFRLTQKGYIYWI
ncbi:MAG: hypothetical protein E7301_11060 [Butyrivibrio sp.]|jgi:hypothetical protein|nr:hypothetical protein [Butyrivibrio sp.]